MALFEKLFKPPAVPDFGALPLASPWSPNDNLADVIRADIVGIESDSVTRSAAMRVPAIVKARAVICGTLSRQPLRLLRDGEEIESPPWLIRSDYGDVRQRMLWTLDDLIFFGRSLWYLFRGENNKVLDAWHVPYHLWEIDDAGRIRVNDRLIETKTACVFLGPQEGLIDIASATIRGAIALEDAWTTRATSPAPLVELHINDQTVHMTEAELQTLADNWEKQRRRGGTAVTPPGIDLRVHGAQIADLFIEGRNASRLDIANYLNVPANLLEGSLSTASLTYSNSEGRRSELIDLSLAYWANAVESRLSADDIVPRGQAVQFNIEYLVQPDALPLPTTKD